MEIIKEFMTNYGMEMIYECLKFWKSRVEFVNDRYEIRNVTGTDEHHPYVSNDAYTNYCVKFIMGKFIELCKEFKFKVDKADLSAFEDIFLASSATSCTSL